MTYPTVQMDVPVAEGKLRIMSFGNARLTGDKLIPIHVQVFFHATQESIVDIGLINVLEEVTQ